MSERDWWRRAFIKGDYPLASLVDSAGFKERTRYELPFLKRVLGLRPGTKLLDVCCGVGRHSLPLAKAGVDVTGLDVSPVYLAEARRRAKKAGLNLRLVRGDMRRANFKAEFDAAMNLWTSFGYFSTAADDLAALRAARAALRPGGRFLLETINGGRISRILRLQEQLGLDTERWTEMPDGTLVLEDPSLVDGGRAVRTRWIFIKGASRRDLVTRIRLYTAKTLGALAERAGFTVERVAGEMAYVPYREASSRRLALLLRT